MLPALNNIQKFVYPLCTRIGKATIGDFIPAGGTIVALAELIKDYGSELKQNKIDLFHKRILSEEPIGEDILDNNFSIDDYYNIIKHCLSDEENAKTEIYAIFYNSLLAGKVKQNKKIILLKAIKDLTCDDLSYLKLKYTNNYAIIKNIPIYEEKLYMKYEIKKEYDPDKDINSMYVHRLSAHGLVIIKGNISLVTELGESLVEILFKKTEITPKWIYKKPKKKFYAFITWKHDFYFKLYSGLERIIAINGFEQHNGELELLLKEKNISTAMHIKCCNIFIVVLNNAADKTTKDEFSDLFLSSIIDRCIFIESIRSTNTTIGLWDTVPNSVQKIFFLDTKSDTENKKLDSYLKSIIIE